MLSAIPPDIIGLISEYLYFVSDRNNFKIICKHVYNGFKRGRKREYRAVQDNFYSYEIFFLNTIRCKVFQQSKNVFYWYAAKVQNEENNVPVSIFRNAHEFLAYQKNNFPERFRYVKFMFDLILERKNAEFPKNDIRRYNKRIKLI